MFNSITKSFEMFQQNISVLQNQLISKDEMIKSLMDTQTKIFDALSDKNAEKHIKSQTSELINVKKNEYQDEMNITMTQHDSKHPQQHDALFKKDQLYKNLDKTLKRLYVGNLNRNVTEDELSNLFGLKSTKYLTQNCSIQMPLNKNTGKSRGYAFLNLPSHICDEVIKLDGIEFKNFNIKIEEAKSNNPINSQSNVQSHFRPQVVANKYPQNQHLFGKRQRFIPGDKSYAEAASATSPSKQQEENNVIFFGDSLTNFSRNTKYEINKKLGGNSKFKYFPGASSKEILHYIDSTLEEHSFNAAVIHVGTNDLINNSNAVNNVAENTRKIARKCKQYGIEKIFISGLVTTTRYPESVRIETNTLIESICDADGYFYVNNNNISRSNLFKDGLHLLENGKNILVENFIVDVKKSFLISRTFHPNVHIEASLV